MGPFSDSDIDDLISCPKRISTPPARELKLVDASWRNNAKLTASDGTEGSFSMFMRMNEDFHEDFSIGLIYSSTDGRGELTLLRCNGKHGIFNDGALLEGADPSHAHWHFHIHRASEKAINAGFAAEKYAEATKHFASYEEALQYFLKTINLHASDVSKYFSSTLQTQLFVN